MIDRSFPLTDQMKLSCRFTSGSLTVHARDDLEQARVAITSRSGDERLLQHFRVTQAGSTIEIREDRDRASGFFDNLFGRGRDGVDIVVDLPSGAGVSATVQAADIRIEGRISGSEIGSGSATVELDEVDGDLRVRGGSGDVTVRRVTGASNFRGGSGRVVIGEAGSDVTVGLGSGNLSIGAAHGAVRMRSGSGGAEIGLAEADVEVTSGSGAVTIGLRAGQPARIDVLTGSGRLHTEMPVESQRPATLSGKPITVKARTGAGDVTIRRAG